MITTTGVCRSYAAYPPDEGVSGDRSGVKDYHKRKICAGWTRKAGCADGLWRQAQYCPVLNERGCQVTVYPADTPAEAVLADKPDGIMLSNGPGDPQENIQIIEEVKKLYQSDVLFSHLLRGIS